MTLKVVRFLVAANLPLLTVDKPEFRDLVHALNPRASLPCRQTLSSVIVPAVVKLFFIFRNGS